MKFLTSFQRGRLTIGLHYETINSPVVSCYIFSFVLPFIYFTFIFNKKFKESKRSKMLMERIRNKKIKNESSLYTL